MLDDSCTAIARNDARRQQDDARCQCQETYAQFKEYIQQTRIDLLDAAFIRLDALALSVIATATWLAGWVAGCHTPVLYQNG